MYMHTRYFNLVKIILYFTYKKPKEPYQKEEVHIRDTFYQLMKHQIMITIIF